MAFLDHAKTVRLRQPVMPPKLRRCLRQNQMTFVRRLRRLRSLLRQRSQVVRRRRQDLRLRQRFD